MNPRTLRTTLCLCLLLGLFGTPPLRAQSRSLSDLNSLWERESVIGLPGDGDDEGDDEASDCASYSATVAKTGQTACWDEQGEFIDCVGTGQDGEYQAGAEEPSPRFTDNLDGSVTDEYTGLTWLKLANCFGEYGDWNEALSDANDLADESCGLADGSAAGDWRLPNVREMQSLLDYSRRSPAFPSAHPFLSVQPYAYWTSSSSSHDERYAKFVSFYSGITGIALKTLEDGFYVWPVRGPE